MKMESTAHASFYFYNPPAEVDRFVDVIREIQKFLGSEFTFNHSLAKNSFCRIIKT